MPANCFDDFINLPLTGELWMNIIREYGPTEALRNLNFRYSRWVRSQTFRYLKDKGCSNAYPHSQDVYQQIWEAALTDIKKFHSGAKLTEYTNPEGWVITISYNSCNQHLRDCLTDKDLLADISDVDESTFLLPLFSNLDIFALPFKNSPIEAEFHQKELLKIINQYFYTLKTEWQIALKMRAEGYSHKEIAFWMHISEANARQLTRRATWDIRQYILKRTGEKR
ncbi:MAG TPA: sigma-70 family RNA polymerase sigma factor [Pyrinomonadaceae bacterium]|jgi:RNA polymerase sigma factor (sigma-70 family)